MLVLSRSESQSIVIGGLIRVCVLSVRRGLVRLGIDAPKTVEIHREEVFTLIERERIARGEAGSTPNP
jgi:carbon storage regulator